jgi:hypothetical protein
MRRALHVAWLLLPAAACPGLRAFVSSAVRAPQVVDRIVARVEGDIVTLSDVRELAAYQQLLDGRAEPDDRVLGELIEQWVVHSEAAAAQFPVAAESEVNREVERIVGRFPSPQVYFDRLAAIGLTPEAVRRIVAGQIYLARYLDYKFRPTVQVDEDAIAKYYQEQLVPALAAKGQTAPPLEAVTGQIRELLVTQGINERAASWIEETKSRLKIEIELANDAPANGQS